MILPKRDRSALAAICRRWAERLEQNHQFLLGGGLCDFFWGEMCMGHIEPLYKEWLVKTIREVYGTNKGYHEYFWPLGDWQSRVKALRHLAAILEAQL